MIVAASDYFEKNGYRDNNEGNPKLQEDSISEKAQHLWGLLTNFGCGVNRNFASE